MNSQDFKQIRLSKDLSKAEFGKLLGISPSHVSHIEAGRRNVSERTRAKIARVIDIRKVLSFSERMNEIDKSFPLNNTTSNKLSQGDDEDEK